MKPTIGRIVIYRDNRGEDSNVDVPAIIQKVHDEGCVRLVVFNSDGQHTRTSVNEGGGPGQWRWPDRV